MAITSFNMKSFGSILSVIILCQLAPLHWALTLPVNVCNQLNALSNSATGNLTEDISCIGTLSITTPILTLPMPPAPFTYRLTDSSYAIQFSNYGGPFITTDIEDCIKQTLEAVTVQIEQDPYLVDRPIAQDLIFSYGTAQLHITHGPLMLRTSVVNLLITMFEWGYVYGYIDCDMKFLQFHGPRQWTLGFGSIVHNS